MFGTILLHTRAFPNFHLLINQFDLSDLHKPPNLESYSWINHFKFSWHFVLLSSFIVKHLNNKEKVASYFLTISRIAEVFYKSDAELTWVSGCECALYLWFKLRILTLWILLNEMQPVPFPCAFIHSVFALLLIVCVNGKFLAVQSKSSEMCQHVTGSGRCPAIQADINGFLFLLSPSLPQPQPTSFHPRFHLLFFPFFLSISSSVSPSWVPRPFLWPCLTFPSSTH